MAKTFGTWANNLVQMGVQTPGGDGDVGSAVAATTMIRGLFGGWEPERTRETVEENVGLNVKADRTYDSRIGATFEWPEMPLTFEQVIHFFDCGLKVVTPTDNTTYQTWAWDMSDGAARTTNTRTVEIGNKIVTDDIHELTGAFPTEIKLSGKRGEAWLMSGAWTAQREVKTGAFTAAIAIPTVVDAMFSNASFYVDDSGGTIGTTAVEAVLMSAEFTIDTGVRYLAPGDGLLYPKYVKRGRPMLNFAMTYELVTDGATSFVSDERANYDTNSVRLMRLTTPASGSRRFAIDLAARYDNFGAYEQEDDVNTVISVEGHAVYSSADSMYFSVEVDNQLSSMP